MHSVSPEQICTQTPLAGVTPIAVVVKHAPRQVPVVAAGSQGAPAGSPVGLVLVHEPLPGSQNKPAPHSASRRHSGWQRNTDAAVAPVPLVNSAHASSGRPWHFVVMSAG